MMKIKMNIENFKEDMKNLLPYFPSSWNYLYQDHKSMILSVFVFSFLHLTSSYAFWWPMEITFFLAHRKDGTTLSSIWPLQDIFYSSYEDHQKTLMVTRVSLSLESYKEHPIYNMPRLRTTNVYRQMQERKIGFTIKKARRRKYSTETLTDAAWRWSRLWWLSS